jgi:hypothetical protein
MNLIRSFTGDVSNQGIAILADQGLAMQFRRSVTCVAGLICYLSTRTVPRAA